NRVARPRIVRIARGGEHDTQRNSAIPTGFGAIERAVDRMKNELEQIGLEPQQYRLSFRVAEAAIELERINLAGIVNHHPRIQEPDVRLALRRHAVNRWHDV